MAEDILEEAKEALRQEQLKTFWKRYRLVIIWAVMMVIGVIATQSWLDHSKTVSAQSRTGALYDALSSWKKNKKDSVLQPVIDESSDATAAIALFYQASELVKKEKFAEAIALYDTIASNQQIDAGLRDWAAILSIYFALETDTLPDNALDQLKALSQEKAPWRSTALLLHTTIAIDKEQIELAEYSLHKLLEDETTPLNTQRYATMLHELLFPLGHEDDDANSSEKQE